MSTLPDIFYQPVPEWVFYALAVIAVGLYAFAIWLGLQRD